MNRWTFSFGYCFFMSWKFPWKTSTLGMPWMPLGAGSEFPEYQGGFLGATQLRMTWCIHMSDMDDTAQQVRKYWHLSVACHFILAASGAASEEPRFTPSLSRQLAESRPDWTRLDLHLIFIITVTISIFIICHPSQSLSIITPTKHKTELLLKFQHLPA